MKQKRAIFLALMLCGSANLPAAAAAAPKGVDVAAWFSSAIAPYLLAAALGGGGGYSLPIVYAGIIKKFAHPADQTLSHAAGTKPMSKAALLLRKTVPSPTVPSPIAAAHPITQASAMLATVAVALVGDQAVKAFIVHPLASLGCSNSGDAKAKGKRLVVIYRFAALASLAAVTHYLLSPTPPPTTPPLS